MWNLYRAQARVCGSDGVVDDRFSILTEKRSIFVSWRPDGCAVEGTAARYLVPGAPFPEALCSRQQSCSCRLRAAGTRDELGKVRANHRLAKKEALRFEATFLL